MDTARPKMAELMCISNYLKCMLVRGRASPSHGGRPRLWYDGFRARCCRGCCGGGKMCDCDHAQVFTCGLGLGRCGPLRQQQGRGNAPAVGARKCVRQSVLASFDMEDLEIIFVDDGPPTFQNAVLRFGRVHEGQRLAVRVDGEETSGYGIVERAQTVNERCEFQFVDAPILLIGEESPGTEGDEVLRGEELTTVPRLEQGSTEACYAGVGGKREGF